MATLGSIMKCGGEILVGLVFGGDIDVMGEAGKTLRKPSHFVAQGFEVAFKSLAALSPLS